MNHNLIRKPLVAIFEFSLLAFLLSGCAASGNSEEQVDSPLSFSVNLEVNADQEIHSSFIVSNTENRAFSEDPDIKAEMYLWDQNAILRSKLEAPSIGMIQPGESVHLASWRWHLDPGIYFLTWGSPEYGGVISVFSVIEKADRLFLGTSQSLRSLPTRYDLSVASVGRTESFALEEGGTIYLQGVTPLPEDSCIFPLLLDHEGILEAFPFGQCAHITDGSWTWQTPSDPGSLEITIKPDTNYKVILLSKNLTLPPSEPFGIHISPPIRK